jgi:FkbM family methyltransferase
MTSHDPTNYDAIVTTLLRCPGVSRARLEVQADGHLVANVVPWGRLTDHSDSEIVAEVAGINPHETRFLHDEIFVEESYLSGGVVLRQDSIIFDVGANIGMFALFVSARCPSASIFTFEPIPETFEKLRHNVTRHGVPGRLFQQAISDAERYATFNYYPAMSIMSCREDYGEFDKLELVMRYVQNAKESGPSGREEHLAELEKLARKGFEMVSRRCRLRRLSSLIEETEVNRIDLLKIDVQRAELDVLLGIDDRHWTLVQQISMEVHDEIGTETEGRNEVVRSLLKSKGFDISVSEEDAMRGTGRYAVQAVRPEYAHDPRPIVAAAGGAQRLDAEWVREWLAERLPASQLPDRLRVVDDLSSHR